uniref:Uncharacterized protein n=1 Tax=Rhizophora mucronata TaxID=61149 RepID=A0A2P2KYF0_RHIMU
MISKLDKRYSALVEVGGWYALLFKNASCQY